MADDPTGQVWRLIEVLTAASALVAERTEQHDDDPVNMRILATVAEQGAMRPTDLRDSLGISAAAVTRRVRSLADEGLLTVAPDPDDGRAYTVQVSRAGQRRLQAFGAQVVRSMRARLADWSDDEIETLTSLLGRFVSSAHATGARARGASTARPWWREHERN